MQLSLSVRIAEGFLSKEEAILPFEDFAKIAQGSGYGWGVFTGLAARCALVVRTGEDSRSNAYQSQPRGEYDHG